ncbi:MAG: hypothetical protein ACQERD_02445 [Campylobacterota bacterium]
MKENLINESLTTGNFTSSIHSIDTIVADNVVEEKDYIIPTRYYKNKLVMLPVNKSRSYFYWEFTEEFLDKNSISLDDIFFHIVDQKQNLLANIKCEYLYGEYFYNIDTTNSSLKEIKVIAVYKDGMIIKNLMESDNIKIINKDIIYATYLKKTKRIQEYSNISCEYLSSKDLGEKL